MKWELLTCLLEKFSISRQRNHSFSEADCIMLLTEDAEDLTGTVYIVSDPPAGLYYHRSLLIYPEPSGGKRVRIISDNYICTAGGSPALILNHLLKIQAYLNGLSLRLEEAHNDSEAVEMASSYTGAPYFYFDASYRVLAMAGDVDPDQDPEWKHMLEKGFLSPESIKLMQDSGDLDMLADKKDPWPYNAGFFPFSSLVCNIWINGQFYSRLNMLGTRAEPDELNRQECRIICRHLLRIAISSGTRASYSGPLSHMVRDLLQGLYLSEDFIQNRLTLMPQLKNSLVQVCCVEPNAGNDPQVLQYYTRHLDRLFSPDNLLVIDHAGKIVLILHADSPESFEPVYRKLSDLLKTQGLTCGASNIFRRFNQLRYYYLQALQILSLSSKEEPLTFFHDKYWEHLLSFLPAEQAAAMVSPDIRRLRDLEQDYQFPLTDTLRTYLECGCNLQKTADRLFIHKNTALYRINHIRQLIHTDLEEEEQRMQLWFSFRILDLPQIS